jgi:hypothetical protein
MLSLACHPFIHLPGGDVKHLLSCQWSALGHLALQFGAIVGSLLDF